MEIFGGLGGVFFLKRGMGKLWDSMYYLMGGRGVVNNFKNRTVIAALF